MTRVSLTHGSRDYQQLVLMEQTAKIFVVCSRGGVLESRSSARHQHHRRAAMLLLFSAACHAVIGGSKPPTFMSRIANSKNVTGTSSFFTFSVTMMAATNMKENSMLEHLAPELLVRVLVCLDIRDVVEFAACNPFFFKRIYQDCPQRWHVMSFQQVPYRERLTDAHLATLLTRVKAKDILQELHLGGCKEIRGHGLAPIRGSQVLETINLMGTCATKNLTPFLWILQTLVPFKFCNLQVDYSLIRRPELVDFMRKLRESKLEQAHDVTCSACLEPLVDTTTTTKRQVIPNMFGTPNLFCTTCHAPFCKRPTCPASIRECGHCGESHCDSCYKMTGRTVVQCGFCGRSHCNTDVCGGGFKRFACVSCPQYCCNECEASMLVSCSYCKKRKTCMDCAKQYTVCEKDCILCSVCQEKGNCCACSGQFCVNCIKETVRQCHQCRLVFCDKAACTSLVEHCGASVCNEVHCKQCRDFECCVTCEKSFCIQHDRLVDCFKCGVRHCRACGFTKHLCPWCNRPCYEDCMCAEFHPASKKPKTTAGNKKKPVKRKNTQFSC